MRAASQPFKAIRERDVDLLLVEELAVTPAFRAWFLRQLGQSPDSVEEFVGVWHSVSDSELGESDIEFGVIQRDGTRLLVLIENKIDAIFQDEQLERYRRRGEKATTDEWDEFVTGLVAPEAYVVGTDRTKVADATMTYEAVCDWFQNQDSRRGDFKAVLITEAIEQNRRGYTREPDEEVTSLHRYYWELARDNYPELGMDRPDGVPSGNLWVRFDPPSLPTDVKLIHKMGRGDVDLQFSGAADLPDAFVDRYEPLLEDEMEIVHTGQSMSIRIIVPPLSEAVTPQEQREQIETGQQMAYRLLSWYEQQVQQV
ncbi:PD-(D/E)XK nuclease family protein [Haloprofundus halophilus]|uniref:PD-(D/E)XK nuclease family protein n=1 Tax=Haloprofundus halophilus TaxID=2283527 RepID=UPI001300A4FA|nr:PD-(D/E)XK nuclease family protein [Haloprofundus halophilus]